ncbi:uncharacterized protein PFL1_04657 [Pseudozyma flocculosa PF-1]|uniref:EamA domain-containing protein n=2 Tax=Pseudozyma flocculosa TaxID=84751 RepID=A0A5C3FC31_9BASI|nr:uncharacterized protein PFL1_04657 [Pseudozyma flocculosa PF-1]EPQ27913.1 hypothetical protein PFL1_04657 [Pseudozyma flocculosa PF-1]SPO41696.1 uncharacterized protein PSFLO_07178 [Pseudozyma flocculosa]
MDNNANATTGNRGQPHAAAHHNDDPQAPATVVAAAAANNNNNNNSNDRRRRSSARSHRPAVGSAAPSDRIQAAHFPAMTPLSCLDAANRTESLASSSSFTSSRFHARSRGGGSQHASSDAGEIEETTDDDEEGEDEYGSENDDELGSAAEEGHDESGRRTAPAYRDDHDDLAAWQRPVMHQRFPTKPAEDEARDEVGELGAFSYTRVPRLFPSQRDVAAAGSSSFAGSDVESQSMVDETRSIFSDVASIFHPNEYLVAQQHAQEVQAYENEVSERGSVFTAADADQDSQFGGVGGGVGDGDEVGQAYRSRRPSTSLLSIASAKPSMRSNYGAIGHGAPPPASMRQYGGASSISFAQPGYDRMDADASAITMREALVSHSTKPGTNLGLVLIAISQVCYSTMNLFVKLLEDREGQGARREHHSSQPALGALEIVGVECLIIWIGCVITMSLGRSEHILLGPPGTRLLLLARGMFGFGSTLALYISLQTLSLSDATVITFLSPLATGLLANLVLAEPFTAREKLAGFMSLCGVVLIARPSFLFGTPSGQETAPPYDGDMPEGEPGMGGGAEEGEGARLVGISVALLGVFLMAGAWVCLRHIGKRASTYHSIAYFALCSWVCSFLAMAALGQPMVMPDSIQSMLLLTSVGLFSLLAQVFQTLGLQRETAARAATMSYLQIIFALFWQLALFGTPLEWLSVVGSVLILANGAWVALAKSQEGGDDAVMAH